MRRALTFAALAILAGACPGPSTGGAGPVGPGGTSGPGGPGPDGGGEPGGPVVDPNLLEEMEQWAERACACESYACYVAEMDLANNLRTLRVDWWTADQRARGVAARTRASDCGFDNFATAAGWPDAESARAAYREAILSEDLALLRQVYDSARNYWVDHGRSAAQPSTGPTPALGTCCAYADGVCPEGDASWQAEPWVELGSPVRGAHRFSFEYDVDESGKGFTVRGYADLDCDGEYTTYELRGSGGASGPSAFPTWKVDNAGE